MSSSKASVSKLNGPYLTTCVLMMYLLSPEAVFKP